MLLNQQLDYTQEDSKVFEYLLSLINDPLIAFDCLTAMKFGVYTDTYTEEDINRSKLQYLRKYPPVEHVKNANMMTDYGIFRVLALYTIDSQTTMICPIEDITYRDKFGDVEVALSCRLTKVNSNQLQVKN